MKALIITEGYVSTGYGHISRCTAIAKAFEERNIDVSFIVNGDDHVYELLWNYSLLIYNWLDDFTQLLISLEGIDIVLIDSYLAPQILYDKISAVVPVCIYLDDYNRIDYPEGIIVNATVGAELIPYKKDSRSSYLLGKDYVILRDPFRDFLYKRDISTELHSVLVTFGGTDPLHITPVVLSYLTTFFPNLQKEIVLGTAFSQSSEIEELADRHTKIHKNVDAIAMRDLMMEADFSISAAGQTVNELAITGLPSILFKVADNQVYNIEGWRREGFIDTYIDATKPWDCLTLSSCIEKMFSAEYRKRLSENGRKQIDGKGAYRIVAFACRIFYLKYMIIRLAKDSDSKVLLDLANDKLVRYNSFSTHEITKEEHAIWFASLLKNDDRKLFVFYYNESFIGQVRFDREKDGESAVISVSISAPFRGLGLASCLLNRSLLYYKNWQDKVRIIYAYVKSYNESSKYAFLKAGFKLEGSDDDNILKFYYVYEK